MTLAAGVVFPLPLDQTFHYRIPQALEAKALIGCRVLVPLGRRTMTGFIVEIVPEPPPGAYEVKDIQEVLDETPSISPRILALTRRLSRHYFSSWGELLQASLPPALLVRTQTRLELSPAGKEALARGDVAGKELELLRILEAGSYTLLHLRKKLREDNVASLAARLQKKGLIAAREKMVRPGKERRPAPEPPSGTAQLQLDFGPGPGLGLERIVRDIREKSFGSYCLTGSRDVRLAAYLRLLRIAAAQGEKTLFLVPEVALAEAVAEKIEKAAGFQAACVHSELSPGRRQREWLKIKKGDAEVVIGSRSALFSPIDRLRLIIVDEEHDESHRQKENPAYDARRGSCFRAEEEKAVVVFGSATPSVETYHQAQGEGRVVSLGNESRRAKVLFIDDRREKGLVSPLLRQRIAARLERKEPVVVFYNRRGYASFLYCSKCSYTPRCRHCDIHLTYHKKESRWICHYCNAVEPFRRTCPECGSPFVQKPGFGIEAVEEELKKIFPGRRVFSFNTDTLRGRGTAERILSDFRGGKIDILLGTELLAHQVLPPEAPLAAVLFPETLLGHSDFQASQKTFLAVSRMARFAKDDARSELIIQTAAPSHYSLRAAVSGDYMSFYEPEIAFRRIMNYPPFSFMAEIILLGRELRTLGRKSREFRASLEKYGDDLEVLGPAMASVARVRGISRIQIIVKSRSRETLHRALHESLASVRLKKTVSLFG